jgi:hypothetical protein
MKLTLLFCAVAALALSACSSRNHGADQAMTASSAPASGWRSAATNDDRDRLRRWRSAFVEALDKARAAGNGAAIEREGLLLQPDAALAFEAPAPGDYDCRVVKLGARSPGMLDFVAYPTFLCRIEAEEGRLRMTKIGGSQRPRGLFFPYLGPRMVFLGTLQLGDESHQIGYGVDRDRDMAGFLERIGDGRWRLLFPYPHFESTMDVMELVPRRS